MIASLSNGLIDRFETKGEADIITEFATPIPLMVICDLLGVPSEMGQQLLAWSHDMVAMYQARRDRSIEDAAVKATVAFSDFMRGYIHQRRKDPRDDLLSELIRAEEQGQRLSEDELVTTAILLLNAGHEATVHAIGNGVKALLELGHPRWHHRWRLLKRRCAMMRRCTCSRAMRWRTSSIRASH